MYKSLNIAFGLTLAATLSVNAQTSYQGIGREATTAEVKAWDIDVRRDFTGLPKGSGSVAKGNEIWDNKCASCHGTFGESNQVFTPLVGGTTKKDIELGRVAGLINGTAPYRTMLMKVSTISTLWDYINRAMPWNAPKSLSTDEVYAVTAYLLNMGEILPDDFVLSNENMAEAQKRLPNRNGKTEKHGLWDVKGKPDVKAVACMNNCGDAKVTSFLPDYVRNAHGNIADQNRLVGPYRGIDTTKPAPTKALEPHLTITASSIQNNTAPAATVASLPALDVKPLLNKYACTACHGVNNKIVGPSFIDIAKRYASRSDSVEYLSKKIKTGGQGVWGAVPMPAQSATESDIKLIAQWLAQGAK